MNGTATPKAPSTMTGLRKCAIGLMAFGEVYGAKVLPHLPKEMVARIAGEATRMPQPTREQLDIVIAELYDVITSGSPTALAGRDFTDRMLYNAFGENADEIRNRMASTMAGKSFEFLEEMEHGQVAALLETETDSIKALVLGHLNPLFRHSVITLLPETQQGPVVLAMGSIKQPNPDAVTVIAEQLRQRSANAVLSREKAETIGGVQAVVDVINRSGSSMEKRLLQDLEDTDPLMAAQVRELMFTFADFVSVSDAAMEEILRGVNVNTLAKALQGANSELESKMLSNVANLLRQELAAEREGMRKVSRTEQEEARGELVTKARILEAEDKITLRGEEDYV